MGGWVVEGGGGGVEGMMGEVSHACVSPKYNGALSRAASFAQYTHHCNDLSAWCMGKSSDSDEVV